MTIIRKILLTLILFIISFVFTQLLNHEIIERFINGNPCRFDTDNIKTGKIFDLFYTISSNTGFHPEPSFLNFIFTTSCGMVIGYN